MLEEKKTMEPKEKHRNLTPTLTKNISEHRLKKVEAVLKGNDSSVSQKKH